MAKNYYDVLEVPRTADSPTICEAYRRLATKWYPKNNRDKLMEAEFMFHEVAEAFEVLSDPVKRTAFDQFGEFGLKNGTEDGRGGFQGGYEYLKNAEKIYESFCKRTNPFFHAHEILGTTEESSIFGAALRGLEGPQKTPPTDLQVDVLCTLPELYNGATKTVTFHRVKVNIDKVTTRLEESKKEVYIKRGYGKNVELRFEGEGNESPIFPSSSLIIRVQEAPHAVFFRKESDLVYTHSLTLLQALMAEPFSIRTMDGRLLYVSFDEVISPETRKVIKGEGMPISIQNENLQLSFGDLIIRFDISFPKYIPEAYKSALVRIFSPPN